MRVTKLVLILCAWVFWLWKASQHKTKLGVRRCDKHNCIDGINCNGYFVFFELFSFTNCLSSFKRFVVLSIKMIGVLGEKIVVSPLSITACVFHFQITNAWEEVKCALKGILLCTLGWGVSCCERMCLLKWDLRDREKPVFFELFPFLWVKDGFCFACLILFLLFFLSNKYPLQTKQKNVTPKEHRGTKFENGDY